MKRPSMIFAALLASVLTLSARNAAATFDGFMQISGIDGESADAKHKNWIDVLGLAEAVTNTSGRAAFADISVIKALDKSSPPLYSAAAKGNHLQTVTIEFTQATGNNEVFLRIVLTNAIVTALKTNATPQGSGNRPTETVSFQYEKINFSYIPITAAGPGSPVAFDWNVVTNMQP